MCFRSSAVGRRAATPSALALGTLSAAFVLALSPRDARGAEAWAEPPPAAVAVDPGRPTFEPSFGTRDPDASVVRFLAGPAGKFDLGAPVPGLFVGLELGRAPTGVRFAAAWLDAGSTRGVSQYTGELTIDFGGRSRIRPVIGAGGGVARTSTSTDAQGRVDEDHGATLGVGVVRGGVGVRLPFDETDARVVLDVSGVFPAIRGDDAPRGLTPWALGSVGVAIGF